MPPLLPHLTADEPRQAVLGVTWRCNSRCRICDVWSRPPRGAELTPRDYQALPRSLIDISLGGYGEPYLRDDIDDVVWSIHERCPRARLVLVTNGLLPERIAEQTRRMPRGVAVRVSLDGIGPTHDDVRGVPGAFDKAMRTLDLLEDDGVRDLGVGLIINRRNFDDVTRVFELARGRGLRFACTLVQSSDVTFGDKQSEMPPAAEAGAVIRTLEDRLLAGCSTRDWAMAYFLDGLGDLAAGGRRRLPCGAGREHFYGDPGGAIFPCNLLGIEMGRLADGSFPSLTVGQAKVHAQVARCARQCWMTCTVTAAMRRHPLGPIAWMIRHRLRHLVGR